MPKTLEPQLHMKKMKKSAEICAEKCTKESKQGWRINGEERSLIFYRA